MAQKTTSKKTALTGQTQQQPMATTLGQQPKPQAQEQIQGGVAPVQQVPGNQGGAVEELDVFGEVPQARFGHTITLVSKTKVVLFGGATGDTGKYSMTGETYLFNILTKTWSKLNVKGVPPSPRAAHSSTNVEQMQMVVYGGATGGGSLASDDLYLLDMRNGEEMAQWMIVPVVGSTPGRRYGHTIIFSKPHLLVFGGNTGQEPVNDVWCLSVEKAPFSWIKLDCGKENPSVRVYHSAALCQTGSATGMMVVFGGRTGDQSSLNDSWGLRRHRDGRWDWVKAPYKASGEQPTPRYQHSTLFLGPLMMVIGGRTNQVGEIVPLEVYDTESSEWYKFNSLQRFRHACWSVDANVYVHGGFEHETPNIPINVIARIDTYKLFSKHDFLTQKIKPIETKKDQKPGKDTIQKNKNATNIYNMGQQNEFRLSNQAHIAMSYTGQGEAPTEDFSMLVRQISIDKLQEEPKKLGPGFKNQMTVQKNPHEAICQLFMKSLLKPKDYTLPPQGSKFPLKREDIIELATECINILAVQPTVIREIKPPVKVFGNIHGNYADLMRFFDIWKAPSESGDIHGFDYVFLGNYVDRGAYSLETICLLMALKLKYPKQIFLLRGNHEDRNVNKYLGFGEECTKRLAEDINQASSVFAKINEMFDYLPLAAIVLDKGTQNKVFCVHGGIGSTAMKVEEIEKIQRPIQVSLGEIATQDQQLVVDLLWSDPTDSEEEVGIMPNIVRDPLAQNNIMKFGADRVDKFLKANSMSMILRSHQICNDGLDRFAQGQLITINSCTDYCNKYGNDACFIVVQKKIIVSPKIIKPTPQSKQNWAELQQVPEGANSSVRRPLTPPRMTKALTQ